MGNKLIRVYEHQKLSISDIFTPTYYKVLIGFGEKHGFKYFNIGRNSVKFKSYVGIIQVGKLTIEILPKTYKDSDDEDSKDRCHEVLLTMLYRSGMLVINHPDRASQNFKKYTLLELFFKQFLKEAEELIYHGLKKQYKKEEKNRNALKGKLLFTKQMKRNSVHKEKFYTSAENYDRDNIYNRIIKKALAVIDNVTNNRAIKNDVSKLLLHLEDIKDVKIIDKQLNRLKYNRQTERYRTCIELAKLIILQMMPDLSGGKNSVIALLFDMNDLFELYITKELQRALPEYSVLAQKPQRYLLENHDTDEKSFLMKPDITIKKNNANIAILDAKWKLINSEDKKRGVSQTDLYQLYTYANEYNFKNVALIYPKWYEGQKDCEGNTFVKSGKNIFIISLPIPIPQFGNIISMMDNFLL